MKIQNQEIVSPKSSSCLGLKCIEVYMHNFVYLRISQNILSIDNQKVREKLQNPAQNIWKDRMKKFQIQLTSRKDRGYDMLDVQCLDECKDFIISCRHKQFQNFLSQFSSFQCSLLNMEKTMLQ